MYNDPIVLIQAGVSLDFKSESPITSNAVRKTKCTVYARRNELIFLHGNSRLDLLGRLAKGLLIVAFAALFFYPEKLPLTESMIQILIYAGFAIYALVPKLLKSRPKDITPETIEKLAFEGSITRLYWRELINIEAPSRVKAAFLKPAELDQGYQTILLGLTEDAFTQAVSVVKGEVFFSDELE